MRYKQRDRNVLLEWAPLLTLIMRLSPHPSSSCRLSNHYYKEVEINAHGASWNLLLVQPYVDGGPAVCNGTLATMCASNYSSPSSSSSSSPGPSVPAWDLSSSLKAGVSVDGALNDPAVGSKGWSAEMCLPLKEYVKYEEGVNLPPRGGDYWRINFSRVQWTVKVAREGGSEVYVKDEEAPASNWVFQPMGVTNMHLPERWGYAYFSEEPAKGGRQGGREDVIEEGPRDPKWPMREALAQVYEAQKVYTTLYGGGVSYTDSVNALVLNGHLSTHVAQGFCAGIPEMEKTGGSGGAQGGFVASVRSADMAGVMGHVDETRRMWFTGEDGAGRGKEGESPDREVPLQRPHEQPAVSKGTGSGRRRGMLRV